MDAFVTKSLKWQLQLPLKLYKKPSYFFNKVILYLQQGISWNISYFFRRAYLSFIQMFFIPEWSVRLIYFTKNNLCIWSKLIWNTDNFRSVTSAEQMIFYFWQSWTHYLWIIKKVSRPSPPLLWPNGHGIWHLA